MNEESAQTVALQAVAFLIADEEACSGLLRMTGIDPPTLRNGLGNNHVLSGVLGFLLANEKRLLTFCEEMGFEPELPGAAYRRLTGERDI